MFAIQQAILALYIPIVIFSGFACYLYISTVLLPAFVSGKFNLAEHAVALSATAAIMAHFIENTFYAYVRIDAPSNFYVASIEIVGVMKLIVLFSCVMSVAVYNNAVFGRRNLTRLTIYAVTMWLVGFALLMGYNDANATYSIAVGF